MEEVSPWLGPGKPEFNPMIEDHPMNIPVQVTFENMPVSDAVQAAAIEQAARLERYYDRITRCDVVIAAPHRHRHKGQLYSVRIDLTVPGREIVVNKEHPIDHANEDVYLAMRDAFHTARRLLEDHVRRARRQVKKHDRPVTGHVTRLFPDQGFGFIETTDGREIYLHENSFVHDDFSQLGVGDAVSFFVEPGEKGQNATSVRVLRAAPRPLMPTQAPRTESTQ